MNLDSDDHVFEDSESFKEDSVENLQNKDLKSIETNGQEQSNSSEKLNKPSAFASLSQNGTLTGAIYAAAHDSPLFRKGLLDVDDQLEEFGKWWESVQKSLKVYFEVAHKANEQLISLSHRFRLSDSICSFLASSTASTVNALTDSLYSSATVYFKALDTVQQAFLHNAGHRIKVAVKELKEQKRQFDKIMERYDHALSKYGSVSKSKEASAVVEESFQLYELRKNYLKSSFDIVWKVYDFENTINFCLFEVVRITSANGSDNANMNHEEFTTFETLIQRLEEPQELIQEQHNKAKLKFDSLVRQLTESKIQQFRPSAELTGSGPNTLLRQGGLAGTAGGPSLANSAVSVPSTGALSGVNSPVSTSSRPKSSKK